MAFDPDSIDDDTYAHLKALAAQIHRDRANRPATLRPTALLHEAWLRVGDSDHSYQSKAHFMATAALAMRQVLSNYVRDKGAAKRGGGRLQTTLSGLASEGDRPVEFLDLADALDALTEVRRQDADVAVMRGIGGLSVDEIAEVIGVSPRTVDRSWRRARAFLVARLA